MKRCLLFLILLCPLVWSHAQSEVKTSGKFQSLHDAFESEMFNDLSAAGLIADEALCLSELSGEPADLGWSHLHMGFYCKSIGLPELGKYHLEESRNWFLRSTDSVGLADVYAEIGAWYAVEGVLDSALFYYQTAKEMDEDLGMYGGVATLNVNIGNVYSRQENYPQALDYYFTALRMREALRDSHKFSNVYNCIGASYYYQENDSLALTYFQKSLTLTEQFPNPKMRSFAFSTMAKIYEYANEMTLAKQHYLWAAEEYKGQDNKLGMAESLQNIGFVLLHSDRPLESIPYFEQFKEIVRESASRDEMVAANKNIGDAYRKAGQYELAIGPYEQSFADAQISKNRQQQLNALGGLTASYEGMGRYKQALTYRSMYITLADSLHDEHLNKASMELQAVYETEKLKREKAEEERDNEINQAKIREQALKIDRTRLVIGILVLLVVVLIALGIVYFRNKTLRMQRNMMELEQQALKAQMNPHFIFNAINSIQRFILENEQDSAYEYLEKFASLIRWVMETSGNQLISLDTELEILDLYISLESLRFSENFDWRFEVDPAIEQIGTKIPPMLIQPYVENAIRHGLIPKKHPGLLIITIQETQPVLVVSVKDDGIGRAASAKRKNIGHQSVGMAKTRERLQILSANFNIENSVQIVDLYDVEKQPAGTEVRLKIPIQY